MVCYSKDAVKSENHKKPYFLCFHYQLRARYIYMYIYIYIYMYICIYIYIYIYVANVGAMI